MEDRGLEPLTQFPGNRPIPLQGGADCGALGTQGAAIDLGLVAVIQAWPGLRDAIQVGILAMVEAVSDIDQMQSW